MFIKCRNLNYVMKIKYNKIEQFNIIITGNYMEIKLFLNY